MLAVNSLQDCEALGGDMNTMFAKHSDRVAKCRDRVMKGSLDWGLNGRLDRNKVIVKHICTIDQILD